MKRACCRGSPLIWQSRTAVKRACCSGSSLIWQSRTAVKRACCHGNSLIWQSRIAVKRASVAASCQVPEYPEQGSRFLSSTNRQQLDHFKTDSFIEVWCLIASRRCAEHVWRRFQFIRDERLRLFDFVAAGSLSEKVKFRQNILLTKTLPSTLSGSHLRKRSV